MFFLKNEQSLCIRSTIMRNTSDITTQLSIMHVSIKNGALNVIKLTPHIFLSNLCLPCIFLAYAIIG